ncbi:ATP-grasp domain-containing protein [Anabaena sp. CCY 9910]|uniref:ATP-grasp domain-containing protein n=1 Tax=Anabaena sp. CCY 9910 TaxID=3103870 RepID=UPI0039E01A7A
MNIAITAIGSMSAEAVIKSLRKRNSNKIIGFDIYPQEWIVTSKLVDFFYQVPLASDEKYMETILQICLLHEINFLIALTDPEIDFLSLQIQDFKNNGIILCFPDLPSLEIARDKFIFFNFFKDNNEVLVIPTFDTIDKVDINESKNIIAKPRKGRSSEGIIKSINLQYLQNSICKTEDYIFQPIIQGNYITVDTIRDDFNNKVSIPRRELLRTMNGAGVVVEIFKDENLENIVSIITDSLSIRGCINIEFILYDNQYFLMDINPRFSAGIAFSIIAGYDFVENHLRCFQGIAIDGFIQYKQQIMSKRYADIVY